MRHLRGISVPQTFVLLLVLGAIGLAATAAGAARAPAHSSASALRGAAATEGSPATCVVHSLPSFVAQGEETLGESTAATVADVIEVECNPTIYGTGSKIKITASQLFSRCKGGLTWYVPNPFGEVKGKLGVSLTLDADGSATVALLAGPGCAAGESLITAHMEEEPFETFTTAFTVLPPMPTTPGVFALPSIQVEGGFSSSVATIVQAEFAEGSEKLVHIGSEELFHRCRVAPHLRWVRMNGIVEEAKSEVEKVRLDNDGNAFVILIGDGSCAEGASLIEADLESKPFTTFTTNFTVLPPQPTAEPSFTIEKLQEIAGSATGFTTATLKGSIGQTVDYEIVVRNTGSVPENFSGFSDAHCDPGTIAGGPGSSQVAPGQSTTYTCRHVLVAVGTYTNEATLTGTTAGGTPVTHTSNQVVVEVPAEPSFTIEKRQQIAGSGSGFSTAPLTGAIGQTINYQILVTNTGNVPLTFSSFTDPRCDPGTIAGGPGATPVAPGSSTTYTCSRLLATAGTYVNEATVTGTPPGEAPLTHTSNRVEANVPAPPGVSFTIEKLQHIVRGSGGSFTTAPLNGEVGQTVAYEIIVKNTGKTTLTFSNFTDAHCDKGTIAGGPGGSALAPGSSTTYTCSHVLTSPGRYVNEASVTGTAPGGSPLMESSNQVEVIVASHGVEKFCKALRPVLHGASGPKRGVFAAQVSSRGIDQITFYLDGRKLKALKQSQAKGGNFTIKIDARALSRSAHTVSFKALMSTAYCSPSANSAVFVRPFQPIRVIKNFTG